MVAFCASRVWSANRNHFDQVAVQPAKPLSVSMITFVIAISRVATSTRRADGGGKGQRSCHSLKTSFAFGARRQASLIRARFARMVRSRPTKDASTSWCIILSATMVMR